jgi:hypothetical protein
MDDHLSITVEETDVARVVSINFSPIVVDVEDE